MADNAEQAKKIETEHKESIWTNGVLSVLGQPAQLWLDEMKYGNAKADKMLEIMPSGFLDNPSLSTKDKYGLSLITGIIPSILGGLASVAALSAGIPLIPFVLMATVAAGVGVSVTAEILGRKDLKEEVEAEKKSALLTTGATILSVGTAAVLGMGVLPVMGIGLAVYTGLGGPRSVVKFASLAIKAVASVPAVIVLGGTTGAAKSVQASGVKIKAGWEKIRNFKPFKNISKKMTGKKQGAIAELQSKVSVLTEKVADLEKAFVQSAAKTSAPTVTVRQKLVPKKASPKKKINK